MRRTVFAVFLCCAVTATSAFVMRQRASGQEDSSDSIDGVVYQTVNVRSGPDTRFDIVGQLRAEDDVRVTGRSDSRGRWLQIALPDGAAGWIPSFVVTLSDDAAITDVPVIDWRSDETPSAQVTAVAFGRINVRSGPEIAFDIVAQLDIGEQAQVVARNNENNDWLLLDLGEVQGWVAYFTVEVEGDLDALPVRVLDSSEAIVPPAILLQSNFNVRLRSDSTLSAPVIGIVPFASEVTPLARTPDGEWLYVRFESVEGWSTSQLFTISEAELNAIPIFDPAIIETSEATNTGIVPASTVTPGS